MVQETTRIQPLLLTILILTCVSGTYGGWWGRSDSQADDDDYTEWWEDVLDYLDDNWEDVDWDEPEEDQGLTG